jgi:ABC-type transport system involved in Fe-S cluster assembly fused permease/ATPase subunit
MNKKLAFYESVKLREDYKRKLFDSLSNIKTIKMYGTEKFELEKFEYNLKNYQVT